jgi:membrane protease YdiL (CAAX protease family)
MTTSTNTSKNKTVQYIVIALLSLLGAFFLPDLLQYALFICMDKAGIPYDYFIRHQNQAYVVTAIVEILLFYVSYRVFLYQDKKSKQARLQPANIWKFILLPSFGVNGLSLLWVLLAEHLAGRVPLLQNALRSFNQSMDSLGTEGYGWLLLAACIVGPVLEELIFRGVLFNALKKVFPHAFLPILISGAAFGIWHSNVVQSVYTAVMGIILAAVYEKTKNLRYPVAIHMLNNLFSSLPAPIEKTAAPEILSIFSIVMIVPLILCLRKRI